MIDIIDGLIINNKEYQFVNSSNDYISDAPNDGSVYGRKNNDWISIQERVNEIYWAVIGDSITNANGIAIENISDDDPYVPIDGYSEVEYKKKNYAYYYAKEHNIKWANYGWGGTTLHSCNSKAYPNLHPFVDDRIENLKEGVDWDYISIFFGWNDLVFGVNYQKDKWLTETYGTQLGYPVTETQIGINGFANAEQKDACDSMGYEYFVDKMIGTIDDDTKDTYMGAYNYAIEYLMKKYINCKIMICVPFLPNSGEKFYNAIKAISEKWSVTMFDFEDLKWWYRLRVLNTTPLINPDREDGKWVNYKGYLCPATIHGYNRARFSLDDTHPSNLGYKKLAEPFGNKLLNG